MNFDKQPEVLQAQEPVAWRNMNSPNGIRRFMTQKQYEANPKLHQYYEPFKCASCASCATLQVQEPVLVVGFERPEWRAVVDVLAKLPDGTKLYTTPQPPAPCSRCAEYDSHGPEGRHFTNGQHIALRVDHKALQAKVASLEHQVTMGHESTRRLNGVIRELESYTIAPGVKELAQMQDKAAALENTAAGLGDIVKEKAATIKEQAALIEKCEKALQGYADPHGRIWDARAVIDGYRIAQEALAALAAHRAAIAEAKP